jgi:hypothetical protein
MSALAIPQDEVEQMKDLARLMPGEPAELFAKMIFGRGLDMGPAQALSQIDFVKGKCELTANAQASRMRAYVGPWGERYDYDIVELSGEVCRLRFWRRWTDRDDEMLGESAFSMDDAKAAGIANDMYRKYARNMLLSRAMSNGVAWFAPETTYGVRVYAVGEIDPGRDHAVPELPEGVPESTAPASDAKQLDAAPAGLPAAQLADTAAKKAAAAPQAEAPTSSVDGPVEHPGDGPPSREDFHELKRRAGEKNLSDKTLHEIADDAKVPSGDTLRERFERATRAQIICMIGNVAFVDPEPAAGEQSTIDGTAAEVPSNAPVEGVAA